MFAEDPGNIESQWWCKPDGSHIRGYHVPYTAQGIRHALGWHKPPAKPTRNHIYALATKLYRIWNCHNLNSGWFLLTRRERAPWVEIASHILENYEKRVRD